MPIRRTLAALRPTSKIYANGLIVTPTHFIMERAMSVLKGIAHGKTIELETAF